MSEDDLNRLLSQASCTDKLQRLITEQNLRLDIVGDSEKKASLECILNGLTIGRTMKKMKPDSQL